MTSQGDGGPRVLLNSDTQRTKSTLWKDLVAPRPSPPTEVAQALPPLILFFFHLQGLSFFYSQKAHI